MAPEVWLGAVDARSDQFSLATAYAAARNGRRYLRWQAERGRSATVPDIARMTADLPAGERRVLHRAMACQPAERFMNCAEFMAALRRAVEPSTWITRLARAFDRSNRCRTEPGAVVLSP